MYSPTGKITGEDGSSLPVHRKNLAKIPMKSGWKWSMGKCEGTEPLRAEVAEGLPTHSEAPLHGSALDAHREGGHRWEKASLVVQVRRRGGAAARGKGESPPGGLSPRGEKHQPYVTGGRAAYLATLRSQVKIHCGSGKGQGQHSVHLGRGRKSPGRRS